MQETVVPRGHSLTSYLGVLKLLLAVPLLALTVLPTSIYLAAENERLELVARQAR